MKLIIEYFLDLDELFVEKLRTPEAVAYIREVFLILERNVREAISTLMC